MVRTFRLPDKMNLDMQIAATNPLNHVTYSNWYTNINSTQFGLAGGGEYDADGADFSAVEVLMMGIDQVWLHNRGCCGGAVARG
jgi:hypothetical protein